MGKKATTTKKAAPAKRAAKPSAAKQPAAEKKAATRAKPSAAKSAAKSLPTKTPGFTADDVALRAYFIAEKRRQNGLPGDEHHDWLEAERQLLAESGSAKKARRMKAAAN